MARSLVSVRCRTHSFASYFAGRQRFNVTVAQSIERKCRTSARMTLPIRLQNWNARHRREQSDSSIN